MKRNCDIVIGTWDMIGRDAFTSIPIYYLLKELYGFDVELVSYFNSLKLLALNPKILYMYDISGSKAGVRMAKLAYDNGIKVISSHSEGMFKENLDVDVSFWGWIPNHEICFDHFFLWNKGSFDRIIERCPELAGMVEVSGSIGHERYRYLGSLNISKKLIRDKYKGVILYCGWGFDHQEVLSDAREDYNYWLENTISLLRSAAKTFKDYLFIFKPHPGAIPDEITDIGNHYDDLSNVMLTYGEIPIHELILSAEVVLVFDSTTVIDSWFCGKTTINLYNGHIYGYEDIRLGSLPISEEDKLIKAIGEKIETGSILEFEEKHLEREKILEKYLCSDIPSPSMHVANYVKKLWHSLGKEGKTNSRKKFSFRVYMSNMLNVFFYRFRFLPSIPRYSWMKKYYQPKRFFELYEEMSPHLKVYYNRITTSEEN